jgi:hypothetical protein
VSGRLAAVALLCCCSFLQCLEGSTTLGIIANATEAGTTYESVDLSAAAAAAREAKEKKVQEDLLHWGLGK